jgi:acyl-CoA reductase-like NAD-dependent aldehyde dehydrogenase
MQSPQLAREASGRQAVALMNESRYGLTATVWTSDVDAAVQIGRCIESGAWLWTAVTMLILHLVSLYGDAHSAGIFVASGGPLVMP